MLFAARFLCLYGLVVVIGFLVDLQICFIWSCMTGAVFYFVCGVVNEFCCVGYIGGLYFGPEVYVGCWCYDVLQIIVLLICEFCWLLLMMLFFF